MDNNNEWLRRSSRPLAVFALSTVVAACQSTGPEQEAPRPPPPVSVSIPLEPIVLPALGRRDVVVEPDLLTGLRSRFDWEIKDDDAVERERAWYARNQAYLDRVFARADLY